MSDEQMLELPPDGSVMSTFDYLRTPESNRVHELWNGVFRVGESPTSWHQDLVFELAVAMREHVRAHDLGKVWVAPLDVILDHERALIVQPDLMFVSREREAIVTNKVWGAPNLVVEVLSPHPRIGSTHQRLEWFARYGVAECWLIHQLVHSVEVVGFDGGAISGRVTRGVREPLQSRVLPSFDRTLADIIEG